MYSEIWKEFPDRIGAYLGLIERYIDLLEQWYKAFGSLLPVLRRVDVLRLHYVRYLAGNPLKVGVDATITLNGKGLPTSLMFLPLTSKDKEDIRFCLTLLTATRAITLDCDPDLQPIVNSSQGLIPKDLASFTETWMNTVESTTRTIAEAKRKLV